MVLNYSRETRTQTLKSQELRNNAMLRRTSGESPDMDSVMTLTTGYPFFDIKKGIRVSENEK